MNSKELVMSTLEFRNTSGKVPIQLSSLPWAREQYPEMMAKLNADFDWDVVKPPVKYAVAPVTTGDPTAVGDYTDAWGCMFTNIHRGVMGEVKEPLVKDDDWEDVDNIHIPEEMLTFDEKIVNQFCAEHPDKFISSAYFPRPFEQLQFIRGTTNLYMDLMAMPDKMKAFIEKMHDYYCRMMTKWAETDVDILTVMDDWGSQTDLLINPGLWEEIFMPMYRDYINIAHAHGKKIFMHSDGHILRIIPKLIDLGLDAVNAQIFCMGIDNLAQFKGKIGFWGEIDRQDLLPNATVAEISSAVQKVYDTLWDNGGCIGMCEFGPGARPENVYEVFRKWRSFPDK